MTRILPSFSGWRQTPDTQPEFSLPSLVGGQVRGLGPSLPVRVCGVTSGQLHPMGRREQIDMQSVLAMFWSSWSFLVNFDAFFINQKNIFLFLKIVFALTNILV